MYMYRNNITPMELELDAELETILVTVEIIAIFKIFQLKIILKTNDNVMHKIYLFAVSLMRYFLVLVVNEKS